MLCDRELHTSNRKKPWEPGSTHTGRCLTILDISEWINTKCGQKPLFRECAKSAYFRSTLAGKITINEIP